MGTKKRKRRKFSAAFKAETVRRFYCPADQKVCIDLAFYRDLDER